MKTTSRILSSLSLLLLASTAAHGAVVYSGVKNVPISNSFTSVYIDVDGMTASTTQSTGWDVDAFFGGEAVGNSASFQPARQTIAVDAPILNLAPGTLVNGSLLYFNAAAGSSTHVGTGAGQFASGGTGYIGFELTDNSGNGPYFGWMQVSFSNTGAVGTIVDWACDNSGAPLAVGSVPEAGAPVLAAAAALTLALRRRRQG